MEPIDLRPLDPVLDLVPLAAWYTLFEGQTVTVDNVREAYAAHAQVAQRVAVDRAGAACGFYRATRAGAESDRIDLTLFVAPAWRGRGIGRRLAADAQQALADAHVRQVRVGVRDDDAPSRAFAERRGFQMRSHRLALTLDLASFDDRPYDALIARLTAAGFVFTTMAALGDSQAMQRRLYELNETSNMETPGTDGTPAWASFADFQQSVCHAPWYRPDGQFVVLDRVGGEFVAMCAITRFDDYAYNLHTGVDRRYRGRKLAQAVRVLALRYARAVLGVDTVRTEHNAQNAPMLAISRKFGYVVTGGTWLMVRSL